MKWLDRITLAIGGPKGRWLTLVLWIVAVAALNMLLPSSGDQKNDTLGNFGNDKPSVQAEQLIKEQFPADDGVPALLTWYRASGLSDTDLQGIQQLAKQITDDPLPYQLSAVPLHKMPLPVLKQQLSKDGTTFVQPILFDKSAGSDQLKEGLDELQKQTDTVFAGRHPFQAKLSGSSELAVRATGPVGISVDATGLFKDADVSLLIATVSLVLLFLLLIYRSPVLALIPLLAVGFAYGAVTPLLGWMADHGWIAFDSQALSIMTVLLFGAGTDYCLFLISRFRSELQEERHPLAALKRAFGGSAGAIAMSGLTVVFSLLVLLLAEFGSFRRFAVPFSLAILIMMIASLTLVPAFLGLFGRASFFPFIPRTREMEAERARRKGKPVPSSKNNAATRETWGDRIGGLVVRRPKSIAVLTSAVLIVCVLFATQIKYTFDTLSSFPEDMGSREGFALIGDHFNPGELAPVQVVVQTDGHQDDVQSALAGLPFVQSVSVAREGTKDPGFHSYEVELADNPYANEAVDHLPDIRHTAEEALTAAGIDHAPDKVWIAGQTAEQYDTRHTTARDARLVIPAIIVLIALLLLLYLRSIVAMLYLVATVLLSYYSALGLGWIVLHYVFGADAIQGLIPLYAFVFIVALGEDYNIFMISGIWRKARSMPLRQAVKEGVSQTGSVITSAGLILAGTFAVLATLPIQVLVQFGTVTAIGVLLDTFVVRPFLVPALTVLCGRYSFWPSAPQVETKPQAVTEQAGTRH
ncbi:MMPL family transporter [Paenibacillus sacheonensis]|uniref:MMPL family transporter n=1 Tax=Paenibacillus sacheonensis TaxID=742054 RepID=A0A7X4YNV3_9BACL|nr:MMPL family transporter [Paenibacillus sacheonensis]MBM7567457.1 RND superfamily putative drug exporter [Paenibacillus sacheonensis]NBC69760.1 MMPL family transporter [Paenibacillus sacheonensis]